MGFAVKDFARSKAFYDAALAPLGLKAVRGGDNWAAYGSGAHTEFWIGTWGDPPGQTHFAFTALNRAAVTAFHAAGLKAGGKDNGPPGIRENYSPHYFAAFVTDPDGHNVEAVCRTPE
jgi:catechol 2,3-dioxygenase-like lactoylglutathione lyase family enzyme